MSRGSVARLRSLRHSRAVTTSLASLAMRRRWLPLVAALSVGLLGGAICWLSYRLPPPSTSDFDPLVVAARALARGADPYAVVRRSNPVPDPLFYPLPAVLLVLPVAWLPLELARAAWAGVSAALFTLAAMRYGRGLAVGLLSAPFLNAIVLGQWSPLLTAGAVLPWVSAVFVAKPTLGAALFAAYPRRIAVWGGGGLLAISLAVMPSWPVAWLSAIRDSHHSAPVLRPGGFLLLLALWRWRRPEARLMAALACVPQIIGLYELVPLFLIPRRRAEAYALAILSYVAAFAGVLLFPRVAGDQLDVELLRRWPLVLTLVYLPALWLVLRPRAPRPTR